MEKLTDISDCLKIDDKTEEVDGKNIFDFLFKTGILKDSKGSDIEKNEKIKSELEIEEEKYLESIFEGKKNEFNSIFSTINGTNTDESPEEKLKKFIWLNFNMENFYLDDNIYIENFSNNIVANRLNISPSAFNKRLKASGLKIYLNNRVKANELLIKSV